VVLRAKTKPENFVSPEYKAPLITPYYNSFACMGTRYEFVIKRHSNKFDYLFEYRLENFEPQQKRFSIANRGEIGMVKDIKSFCLSSGKVAIFVEDMPYDKPFYKNYKKQIVKNGKYKKSIYTFLINNQDGNLLLDASKAFSTSEQLNELISELSSSNIISTKYKLIKDNIYILTSSASEVFSTPLLFDAKKMRYKIGKIQSVYNGEKCEIINGFKLPDFNLANRFMMEISINNLKKSAENKCIGEIESYSIKNAVVN
jgi:hypothetical protein